MNRKSTGLVTKVLPALLAMYGGSALAFEPIKLDDGTVIDVSLQVSYQNLKRLAEPLRMENYKTEYSRSPGVVKKTWPLTGSMWGPAVDVFTQMESKNNTDDGQLVANKHGTISNRVSALMDVNVTKDNYRAFARVNAFRDAKLFQTNDHNAPGTFNGTGPHNEYSEEARRLIGQRTRLLDAYVQGRWKLGDDGSYPLFVKVGRQVVNWGEGLFFQGIGSSMNPMDQVKGMTPGVPAQEAFLPTEQIYGTLGISEKLTVMAYKKWRFRETELAPVGTYFSASDFLGPGASFQSAFPWEGLAGFNGSNLAAQLQLLPNTSPITIPLGWLQLGGLNGWGNYGAWRAEDIGRTSKGQWGLAAKYQLTDMTDVGLYYLNYTETVGFPEFGFGTPYAKKGGGLAYFDGPNPNPNAQILEYLINALTPFNSNFAVRYMNDVKLLGGSFSTLFGDWQVAGELSYRRGAPMMINNLHYNLARANITSGNVSFLRAWSGGNFLWGATRADNVILGGELALQHLNSFEKPGYSVNPWILNQVKTNPKFAGMSVEDVIGPAEPRFDKNAAAYVVRAQFDYTPWPEWDLSIPVFYWRQLVGNGAVQGGWNSGLMGKGSARTSIDANFTYRQNLTLGVSATWWLGDYDLRSHTMNSYSDRDLVAFNATYHF
ncbi:conserved exported protein of unknown function [Sterolibacterium denitrificans]|uniref:DUF1302 domain-containing protein n=1 Tax=Sterolibacterium denitrificans TaxID=157592 RepID=A0A7Z7HU32_9PROT|nr:DUF1302 family protein [Sterolibacterium denitrificans]SMB32111.1 conserved exported protein of unknown function [Sterolibacterium denitrificans]